MGRNLHASKKEDPYFVSNCSLALVPQSLQCRSGNSFFISVIPCDFFKWESIEYYPSHNKEANFQQRLRSCFTLSLVKWSRKFSLLPKGIS
ncbi:hypothetical protein CDAR_227851 [Caerostris darwini]|uniref:Ycf15 n=1 Tax=Caerostris darwini TaxID=1538125 RepID=A0AAV4PM17_9ARAC|nr:hypothetical protein CDAR_227851 [Caerostris darwini]